MELKTDEALALRMRSLLLTPALQPGGVAPIVEWFGAMQAQDMASGLWSLGVRIPGSTAADITAALERREAIRTWPMRGTVHLVPSADARWMLDLMGVRALAGAAKRRETIGLSERTAERGVEVLADALAGGGRLTRAECLTALAEGGVELSGQMGYHLLWYASQRGVTCIAPNVGKEQTFVLLDEWVPQPHHLSREEALATIALRYFRSHGPATRQDFVRWTGLTMTDTKAGIAEAGDALTTVRVDGTEMIAAAAVLDAGPAAVNAAFRTQGRPRPVAGRSAGPAAVGAAGVSAGPAAVAGAGSTGDWVALPGFDEYMLGYKDRSLMLDPEHFTAVVPGGNGVFQSTLVHAGRTVATWKRTLGRKAVTVDVSPLVPLDPAARRHAEEALQPYASFVGLPLEVRWP